jgi:hypothetical protein
MRPLALPARLRFAPPVLRLKRWLSFVLPIASSRRAGPSWSLTTRRASGTTWGRSASSSPPYQRRDLAVEAAAALARQRCAFLFEAIVVGDGSTDSSAEALRQGAHAGLPASRCRRPRQARRAPRV